MPVRIIHPYEGPSPQEDIARSAGTGGFEAALSVPGGVGDLQRLGDMARDKALEVAGRHGVGDGQNHQAPDLGLPNPVQAVHSTIGLLARQLGEKLGVNPETAEVMARAASTMLPGGLSNAPTTQEMVSAATEGRGLYQPQTRAGRYVRTGMNFLPAAAAPGSLVTRAANVAVPAVASEAAGEVFKGTKAEPWARTLAAVIGGGVPSLLARPNAPTRILAEATRGATDAQIAEAQQLMARAANRGVRLTSAEALQQVTRGATGMGRLQRVVEGTKAGGARVAPVMTQRPQQVRQAVTDFADTIAPATDQPSVIGLDANEAAQRGIRQAAQARTAAVDPYYAAADPQTVPHGDMQALLNEMDAEIARDRTGIIGGRLTELRDALTQGAGAPGRPGTPPGQTPGFVSTPIPARPGVPPTPRQPLTDIENLDRVRKFYREQIALPPTGVNPITKEQAGRLGSYLERLDGLMERVPEFRRGKEVYQDFTRAVNDPLEAGPLGTIANTQDVTTQSRSLYPSAPLEGAPAETVQAIQQMGGAQSQPARDLTRQHLINVLNEASQDNQGGPNQWGGAKYAATIAGNPEQARTLNAGVGAVGGDPAALNDMLDVLRATGWRERPGSMTAYNERDIEELGKAGMLGEVARTGLNPPGVFRRIGQGFQDFQTERNSGRLADAILSDPAQAADLIMEARRRMPPGQMPAIEALALAVAQSRLPSMTER